MESTQEKTFYVMTTTEGCATNLLENSAHRRKYQALGYKVVDKPEIADVILINTCAYNHELEDRSIGVVADMQKKFEGKEILLSGCLPKINPQRTKDVFKGTLIESPKPEPVATTAYHEFDRMDFGKLSLKHRFIFSVRPIYFAVEKFLGVQFRPLHNIFKSVVVNDQFYLMSVSTGCLGQCTFCAIKHSKGKLKSRPLAVLMSEFEMGLKAGRRDFWLLGDDIGCYGQDVGSNVAELVGSMLKTKENITIVLNYLDPHWMLKYENELREVLIDPRVICMNVPLQSGSQEVLGRMKRDYDVKRVFKMFADVKKKNPGLAIKTNILVGFPGETWWDLFKTVRAIFNFDALVAMRYSPRPHTVAIKMENQIPERTKGIRLFIVNTTVVLRHAMVSVGSLFKPGRPPSANRGSETRAVATGAAVTT